MVSSTVVAIEEGDTDFNLPRGWVVTTLREAADTTRRTVNPQTTPSLRFIGMEHVEAHTMRLLGTVPASEMRSNAEWFEPGDVLYGRLRPYLNKVLCPDFKGLCSGEFIIFRRSPHLESRYLQHFLNSWAFVSFASHLNEGDRPRVSSDQLADYPFPLPPLSEQRRIVAEIEKHLTRLDVGIGALKRAQANLRRYRASVLKAACEGRLVPQDPNDEPASELLKRILAERRAKWEADQLARMQAKGEMQKGDLWRRRYVEAAGPSLTDVSQLPIGWAWASVAQLSWDGGYGTSQKCDYDALGPPVLRIPNVVRGRVDLTDMKRSLVDGVFAAYDALAAGDLLVVRTNGSKDLIGRSALVRSELPEPHFYASYLIRFRIIDLPGLPAWLATVWHAFPVRQKVLEGAATSAGQYNVSLSSLGRVPIPIPPLEEQKRIVAEVERCLSVVHQLDVVVEANLKRAGRLRQAILKRAFEGKLVPQDPADEPASVLLERVRRERQAAAASTRRTVALQTRLPNV